MLRCREAILIRGLDDWVRAAEVASIARTVGKMDSNPAARVLAMPVIRCVLEDGTMEVGDVTDSGFASWGVSASEAMRRIEQDWRESASPGLGEVCWLSLTGKGALEAEQLWTRRRRSDLRIRSFGWVAIGLATASIVKTAWIVLDQEAARAQLFALRLPLDALGEAALMMLFPLVLSTLATGLGLVSCRRRSGQWGLVLSAVSWAVSIAALGPAGFRALF